MATVQKQTMMSQEQWITSVLNSSCKIAVMTSFFSKAQVKVRSFKKKERQLISFLRNFTKFSEHLLYRKTRSTAFDGDQIIPLYNTLKKHFPQLTEMLRKCQRNYQRQEKLFFVRLESNVLLDKEKKVTKKTWPPNVHVFFIYLL